jgi:sigma-B regulation protein RsbU (phosphoserine phosphatase)
LTDFPERFMPRARILVIDDEPGMLRAVERVLSADYQVITCASPTESLEIARAQKPDLVICDIAMPRLNGFEVMERLRSERPDLEVILMTGMSEPDQQLVRAIRERAFYFIEKPFNREVMLTLVARAMELRWLREAERRHVARINNELADARRLQQAMLPPPQARINGVEIDARYVACSELGGDFYDYADAGNDRVALVVADVAGHGASAAMLTSLVKSAFQSAVARQYEPLVVVRRVAQAIGGFGFSRFITLICARLDRKTGALEFVNAGHPPGIIHRPEHATKSLDPTGPMISPAFGGNEWEQKAVSMPTDARLLLFTDGVTDTSGPSGPFTRERLLECATAGQGNLLQTILDSLQQFADGRPQHDDLTLLTARFT